MKLGLNSNDVFNFKGPGVTSADFRRLQTEVSKLDLS